MDDEQTGYMGVTRWVSFSHHGEPESGEARTMDDGSVWARIAGPDPKGDDDRWGDAPGSCRRRSVRRERSAVP